MQGDILVFDTLVSIPARSRGQGKSGHFRGPLDRARAAGQRSCDHCFVPCRDPDYPGTMLARQRLKLRFGPYRTPKFKYGAKVMDERRGKVVIVGLHDGPIPWPIGKRGHSCAIILYGALAKAVRREAGVAVQHWWGVKHATVQKWRRVGRRTRERRHYRTTA